MQFLDKRKFPSFFLKVDMLWVNLYGLLIFTFLTTFSENKISSLLTIFQQIFFREPSLIHIWNILLYLMKTFCRPKATASENQFQEKQLYNVLNFLQTYKGQVD